MANDALLTDDYVAGLLAKEASESSIKYSSVGLEAFRSTKPANKAKPNTRFLGRIIKETTNHNKALLAKEAAEAQAALNHHNEAEEKKRRRLNPTKSDIRRRQLRHISSFLLGGKKEGQSSRTKPDRDSLQNTKSDRERKDRHSSSVKADPSQSHEPKHSDERGDRRSHRRADDDAKSSSHRRSDRSRSRSPGHRERRERRHRERSPISSGSEDRHRHHSRSDKRRSEKNGRDRDFQSERKHRSNAPDDDNYPSRSSRRSKSDRQQDDEDSDPLEEFIGPAPPSSASPPPVRIRGRGAGAPRRGAAAMDSRFAEDYDPKHDVSPDDHLKEAASSSNPWDSAVEMFRDRQRWKQQGADRLRKAGYTEEQIKKWEKGGKESEEDIFKSFRYTKKGEQREWDRGKSLSDSEIDM